MAACGFALLAGCSGKTAPTGGLLVTMSVDKTFGVPLTLTRLHVEVGPVGDGAPSDTLDFAIPAEMTFPATLAVRSNGNPAASVTIDMSVWEGFQPIDERRYEVFDVPTTTVEDINVVFSKNCTPWVTEQGGRADSACGSGETCNPRTGGCGSDVYGAPGDGGGDAMTHLPSALPDGASGEAGPDAAIGDATLDDGSSASGDGGSDADADASDSCGLDAGAQCDENNVPQQCFGGKWVNQPSCGKGQYCSEGLCRAIPPSCPGYSAPFQCQSTQVPGGTFDRSFDGSTPGTDAAAPAAVYPFVLDDYEVTFDRFAAFEAAVDLAGGLPEAGTGKHAYLNGGLGLVTGEGDGGPLYETGWDSSWNANLATTSAGWDANLNCTPGAFDTQVGRFPFPNYPVNCVTWFEAYAFCIWDGGFLPTEAEWSFAAAGGDQQRLYPWGLQAPGDDATYAIWGCYLSGSGTCTSGYNDIGIVFDEPSGVGRWGQWQLAGNMAEWTLDAFGPWSTPCVDCVTTAGSERVFRGGSFDRTEAYLHNYYRASGPPATRETNIGFRCARSP